MANRHRASVFFVLVTLGLDALGVGIIAPIVPALVERLGDLPPQQAAPWVGALIAAYAAVQFFAAPLLGELSDRFGRRTVILTSVFGLGCDYVLLALAPSLWWLFVGRRRPTSRRRRPISTMSRRRSSVRGCLGWWGRHSVRGS